MRLSRSASGRVGGATRFPFRVAFSGGLLAVAALACGSRALGAPSVAADITPNPDALRAIETTTPALGGPVLAPLAGNFVRGVDMDSATTGYYLCTSNISTSPVGFYRYDNGVSTQVAPLDASVRSTLECGLTLDQNNTKLYYARGVSNVDDELHTLSFAGVFTLVGSITIPGVATPPGSAILGIAVDPATGVMYGVDTSGDQLITIDPATGAGTVVGPLGVAVAAIGALDVDQASGELVLFADPTSTKVYTVNKATGAATIVGSLPFGTSGAASVPVAGCDSIDFNGDSIFPDNQDIVDFVDVFGGGVCPTGACNDIDFNNDGVFPDNQDLIDFIAVFGGAAC
jgi:hypothetical protein